MKRINGGFGKPYQDEVKRCRYCEAEIFWAQSRKTGRWYPANVTRSTASMGAARVALWNVHKCEKRPPAGEKGK